MKLTDKIKIAAALLLITGSVGILSACGTTNAAEIEAEANARIDDAVVREVRIQTAVSGSVEETITRVSTITAPNTVNLLPKISGQITYLAVEEGHRVTTGQVIARLDAEQIKLASERALAVRDKKIHDRDLAQRQFDANIIGKEELLQANHAADQAERDYQQSVLELEKTEVLSPITGVVSVRHASVGDMVFPGTPIVTITDTVLLEADLLIPQDQIERVTVGDKVIFVPGDNTKRAFAGIVDRISPVIETLSGTIKVVARVVPGQKNVMPGQFVKAHIITGVREDAILIPREAIVIENAMSVVYKVVDGYARRVMIELGYPSVDRIQVIGDIKNGDSIVVAGANGLDDMTRVKILPPLDAALKSLAE